MQKVDFDNGSIMNNIIRTALPMLVAQVISLLYSVVDRIYIGRIDGHGTQALGAIGLCFPVIMVITGFTNMFGLGGAPLFSIGLGKNDRKKACDVLNTAFRLEVITGVILMVLGELSASRILSVFGATADELFFSVPYIRIYLIGTVFTMVATGMNPYINAQGYATVGMKSVLIGAVSNIVLDPVFIFGFHLGVRGAAIATVISQGLSAAWVMSFLLGKKTSLKIRRNCMRLEGRILGSVFSLGISPFIMNATESFISIVLNHGLQTYGGDLHVGSLTIMQSIMQLFSAPINGFTQGMTPIVSYNYGARNFSRVKQLYCWMIGMCFGFRMISTATTMFLPRFYAGFFTNEADLVALTGEVMPIFMAGMLVFGLQNGIQPTFLALGQAKISLFIAVLRKIILLIPLAIILPHFMGVMGVYWAEPISDTISAATASALFLLNIRKILSEESLAKIQ